MLNVVLAAQMVGSCENNARVVTNRIIDSILGILLEQSRNRFACGRAWSETSGHGHGLEHWSFDDDQREGTHDSPQRMIN